MILLLSHIWAKRVLEFFILQVASLYRGSNTAAGVLEDDQEEGEADSSGDNFGKDDR